MAKGSSNWATYHYSDRGRRIRRLAIKIIFYLATAFFVFGLLYGMFFIYKLRTLEKKISPASTNTATFFETAKSLVQPAPINLKGMEKDRINILLMGIAGKGKPGQNLTDTIIVVSINPKTNQVALFSIPRDLFVKIKNENFENKINSVYQYGINSFGGGGQAADLVVETVKDITALDINYYAVLNFDGFEKIIYSVGGINIINERDIYDASYPGPNYSYETFELSKGFHQLDGATALKYVRERHDDPQGDFGRAKRQQQVLQATKNKIFSAGTMLNVVALNNLFDALGETIQTNITPEEIGSFMELSKKLDTQNINNFVLDAWNKDSLLKVSHVLYGNINTFVLLPRVGNYSEIQDVAKNIFDLNEITRRKDSIANEKASIAILNQSGNFSLTGKIRKLLEENLGYKNITTLTASNLPVEEKTVVYDFTGGTKPFTLDELVGKLPAEPVYEVGSPIKKILGNRKIDMAISLGKDLVNIYNMDEGTIQDLNNVRDAQEQLNLQSK